MKRRTRFYRVSVTCNEFVEAYANVVSDGKGEELTFAASGIKVC